MKNVFITNYTKEQYTNNKVDVHNFVKKFSSGYHIKSGPTFDDEDIVTLNCTLSSTKQSRFLQADITRPKCCLRYPKQTVLKYNAPISC